MAVISVIPALSHLPDLVDPFDTAVLSSVADARRNQPVDGEACFYQALYRLLLLGEYGHRLAAFHGWNGFDEWLAHRAVTHPGELELARMICLKYLAIQLAAPQSGAPGLVGRSADIDDMFAKGVQATWKTLVRWHFACPLQLLRGRLLVEHDDGVLSRARVYLQNVGYTNAIRPDHGEGRHKQRLAKAAKKSEREAAEREGRKPKRSGYRGMSYEDFLKSKARAALRRKKVPASDANSVSPDQWLIERETFARFAKRYLSRLLACKLRADRYGQQEIAEFVGVSRNTVQTDLSEVRELEEAGLDLTGRNRAIRLPRLHRRLAWWQQWGETNTEQYHDTKRLLEQLEEGALPGMIDARRFWESQGNPESHYFEGLDRAPPTAETPEPAGNGMFEDHWQGRLFLGVGDLEQWCPPPDRVCSSSSRSFRANELDFDRDELTTGERLRLPAVPREVSGDARLVLALERLEADIRLLRQTAGTLDRSTLKRAVKNAGRRLTKLAARLKTAEERGAAPNGFDDTCSDLRRMLSSIRPAEDS